MLTINLIIFLVSLIAIWLAAKLIISTVSSFAHLLRLSSFAVSFFILGLATSLPELFISINAAADNEPEIFAGTLYGATIIIFLFVFPILAIIGKGVGTDHKLAPRILAFCLFVIFLPFIAAIDGVVTREDAVVMILAYLLLFYLIERRQGFIEKIEEGFVKKKRAEIIDLIKIVAAAAILFLASRELVLQTMFIASNLHVAPFLISILILSLGSDIPETALAFFSAWKKTKAIAIGDYLGSAAANTLIFGVLTLIVGPFNLGDTSHFATFTIFFVGLLLFWLFAKSKRNLSRVEGSVLLAVYAVFLAAKIFWVG